jgi:hypothetical protein
LLLSFEEWKDFNCIWSKLDRKPGMRSGNVDAAECFLRPKSGLKARG